MFAVAAGAVALGACGTPPPAPKRLAFEQAPTRVAAWAGTVMWSRFDPASRTYSLLKSVDGRAAVRVAVPPRRQPFDLDLGTNRSDETYAVYTRNGNIYSLNAQTGKESALAGLNSPKADEREPSIMGGKVAFVRDGRLWIGDMTGAAPKSVGDARYVQTTELGVGHVAYVVSTGGDFGGEQVRIRDLRSGADKDVYEAVSGGANAAEVTRPTYVDGDDGFLWARTNLGSGKGNRIIRYFGDGSELAYAQGSPDYGSTAWAGRNLGVATARSLEHNDDASRRTVGDSCGYGEEHYCRVDLTGALRFGLKPE